MDGEEQFVAFVTARRPAWLRLAWLLTGDAHVGEDLVQVALERTARHWSRVSRDGEPEAYVRRAIYTAHVSAWRRTTSRVAEVLGGSREPAPTPGGDPDTRLTLQAALARLTAKQRAVLVLRFYDDLTEPQVAAVLGIGVGTVKSQVRDALARLRVLAPELDDLGPVTEVRR